MKITRNIIVNKPVDQVWDLVAHQFDKASLWMGPIPRSVAVGKGQSSVGAPMEGRLCDLSDNPDGAKVKEIITQFSEQRKTLTFDVLPVNNPAIVPLKKNRVQISLHTVEGNRTEVVWIASPQLKAFAYPFYPFLRLILPVAFGRLLQGLKDYVEKGQPGHASV